MLPTAETEPTPARGRATSATAGNPAVSVPAQPSLPQMPPWRILRVAAIALAGVFAFFGVVLLAYELAVARVPQHRAALERIVRAQTGLDMRFNELGLRWGWYGPEAVFRRVELGEPGRSTVLLRAPELVVGFDAWRSLRSGQLEAGRITLIAPDIDFERVGSGPAGARPPAGPHDEASAARARILQRWQGGRIDIEGGTLRLPDPAGSANPLTLQIRRASLRRSTSEWSGYGLVFLPERLGRTARIVMRLDGDLGKSAALSGTARFEGRRLLFAGWRDLLDASPDAARYLPRAGGGDMTVNVDFEKGRIVKADGRVSAAGLEFDSQGAAAMGMPIGSMPVSGLSPWDAPARGVLALDHLRGEWRLAQRGSNWRLQVDSLELGDAANHATPATLALDVAPSGEWIHGQLEQAPLQSVAAVARWFAPQLYLAGVELGGIVRDVGFDWNTSRPAGQRLRTSARLVDVALAPPSHGFVLTGLSGQVFGDERELTADLGAHAARLELAQAPQYPLDDVHIATRLQISRSDTGWQVMTEKLELQHETAHLRLAGQLTGDGSSRAPQIDAYADLTGADIPLLEKLAGASSVAAMGATVSHLTAGRIEHARIELHGPLDATLPFRDDGTGFTGSLVLREAILSGGELWPDAQHVDARIDWRGARIRAAIETGRAGSFVLASAMAEWDVQGEHAANITGRVTGRLEEAVAWLRNHPKLQEYAPRLQNIDVSGAAQLDFNLTVPATTRNGASDAQARVPVESRASNVHARVSAVLDGARLRAVAGVPPIDAVRGTLVFEAGHLRHSMLAGTWLGGPVTLNVGERRERGALVLAIQGHGQLDARQLVLAATAGTAVDANVAPVGNAEWSGELAYLPETDSKPARWRVRADSSLAGISSRLPEPLAKTARAVVPLHIEVQGTSAVAELRVSVGDRVRSMFSLRGHGDAPWQVERGSVHFGTTPATLPAEPVVLIEGRVSRLDLPAYVAAWQQLRQDPGAPAIRAELVADEMLAAGHSYSEVTVLAERTEAGADLQLHSPDIAGMAHWPAAATASHPAQFHFARLSVPAGAAFDASVELIAALGPAAELSVEDLVWDGHSLGRATAMIESSGNVLNVSDLRLRGRTQEVAGTVRCQSAACRLKFNLDSSDAAATLEDFGFRPDMTAARAVLDGDLEWQLRSDQPVLATVVGRLNMRLEDGTTRADPGPDLGGRPFALLSVPALVSGMGQPTPRDASSPAPESELRFSRLEADFELSAGEASTSNLHFDGDAEILMRGRTGLIARDYDQQVWILRGEGRLPAAVRRLAPTPRVAAVWLSLRELLSGADRTDDGSGAALHLQGSWDDPIVVAAD